MNVIAAILAILSNSIVAGIGNSIATETANKNRCDFNTFYILYNWLSGWCTICLYQELYKEDKIRPVIKSVANLVMNILVVKYFGMAGVLISTIITVIFINIPWTSYILFKIYFNVVLFPMKVL